MGESSAQAIDSSLKITLPVETAIVTVSDSSVRITLDNQMHIFERFYKTDKARDHASVEMYLDCHW